jgi:hypothetical protein
MHYDINSTHIKSVFYDQQNLKLKVNFSNGSVYEYYPFYENQLKSLNESQSKGLWFNENVKKNKSIRFKKIN